MEEIKKILYLPLASYFKFFAAIRLRRWNPKIVVVTGSSGKTTLLHLLESQIGDKAKYSHHANTSFGIPFDILDLHRKSFHTSEWFTFFCSAPAAAFKSLPKEEIYVVEADCDLPGVGKFLGSLLKPHIVLWVNAFRTHSMNFDKLVAQKKFDSVNEAIAYEYGYFLEYCSELAVINGDLSLEIKQKTRTKAKVTSVTKSSYLTKYTIGRDKTTFNIKDDSYSFDALLPEAMFYSLAMSKAAVESLSLSFDQSFSHFVLPPGRSSLFEGTNNISIIDSTYNANLASVNAILAMFEDYPAKVKWAVIGDMLELGEEEKEEHEKLAEILIKMDLQKIILFGPRVIKYTANKLYNLGFDTKKLETSESLKELNIYLQKNLNGGEAVLFKGSAAMMLEGVIEKLLKNKSDIIRLPRQEKFWKEKRLKKLS